jgi:putative colanic acid biosynthesis acetyltransferase WcaB
VSQKQVIAEYTFLRWVKQDWAVNAGYRDSQLVLLMFRLAQWAYVKWGWAGRQFCVVYRLFMSLFVGVELPAECHIGTRLRIFHPHGIVLNPGVVLGHDCILRQQVTIGNIVRRDGSEKGIASVGNGVEFGAGCVVVGDIHVSDNARIGALALVTMDVPERGIVRGNPAQLVRIDDPDYVGETMPTTDPI